MELIIRYSGRKIGFFWEGANGLAGTALGLPEIKVRAIRGSGGPHLRVIAGKVRAILEGHGWPNATAVWVEQHGKRLIACPA